MPNHNYFANLIWQIADLLRGPYRPPAVRARHAADDRAAPLRLCPRAHQGQGSGGAREAQGRQARRRRARHDAQPGLDPACGTGGMLAEAQNYLREHHAEARLYVYGQDYNKRAFATA
ncbi:MAG: N-6 DNA methylase, partial [Gammaproteobacteria bacterium]